MDLKEIIKLKVRAIQEVMTKSNGKVLLNSEYGVKLLKIELMYLFSKIDQMIGQRSKDTYSKIGKVILQPRHCTITGGKLAVQVRWDAKFKNTLEGSVLWVILFKGNPSKMRRTMMKKPTLVEIEKKMFAFHLTQKGEQGWQEIDSQAKGAYLTSEKLANLAIDMLVNGLQRDAT